MSDAKNRQAERNQLTMFDPASTLAARMARIRAGLEELPTTSYTVMDPLHLVPLRAKVEKLNRASAKRGAIPLALYEAPQARWVERQRRDGSMTQIRVRDVTLIGDIPDTGPWAYVAWLHHTPSGTVIHRNPDVSIKVSDETLETYRARGPRCDHCDVRRARHDTYVCLNRDTSETVQLGSACLAEYLGGSPQAAVFAFETRATLVQEIIQCAELNDDPMAVHGVPVVRFLAWCIAGSSPRNSWISSVNQCIPPVSEPGVSDLERAEQVVKLAREIMLPALEAERAAQARRDAGLPEQPWPSGVRKLAERWHNVSVILAEGFVPESEAPRMASLIDWYRAEESRAERTRLGDPYLAAEALAEAIQGVLGHGPSAKGLREGVVVLQPMDLAKLLLEEIRFATPLREVARNILRAHETDQLDDEPLPAGDALGPVGAEGTWRATVTAVRPYNARGGGHVVVLGCRSSHDEKIRYAVVFHPKNSLQAPPVLGDDVRVTGRVESSGYSNWRRGTETTLVNVTFEVV